ncbi:CocE/NonD family hydrolase [Streptomyces sp. NPDC002088]|uniref:CocE/NonD family hydrolase n=1 Tax=Streptomyces sp. NPDC002088 TaxID=3154665 RepID=UPI00331785DA
MNLSSHLIQRMLHLPPPATRNLTVEHDLRVPMRDGAVLLADRWTPRSGGDGLPTALIRVPYGRAGATAGPMVRPLAERGFQVLIQSTRGTFGSDGPWDPLRREREDGLDTIDWVIRQPWFGESMILHGPSYLGFVQWAVADAVPPQVKAMIPIVSESALTLEFLRADGFSLETPFGWAVQVAGQERRFALPRQMLAAKKVQRAVHTLPLDQADTAAIGHRYDYVQNILVHDADAPFWQGIDHRHRVGDIHVPVSSIGGWYDIFLPGQLRDHRVLQDAGRAPLRLTVGPWTHTSMGIGHAAFTEALDFGLTLARGQEPAERAPVRLFVMGEEKWRDFPFWPPPGFEPQRFHLQPGGALSPETPADSLPDGYRYDPADPTPSVGGVRLAFGVKSGRVDNAALEARPDVVTYTTPLLDKDVEVIGDVRAEIFFRSSLPHADVFVRLCVDADGRSTNVCDGLTSLTGADETSTAVVRLWPTAYRFKRGHRIRVQVSSGAFPRFNRNPGTGEPRATATTLRAADQQVFHDPEHPSAIILPTR